MGESTKEEFKRRQFKRMKNTLGSCRARGGMLLQNTEGPF